MKNLLILVVTVLPSLAFADSSIFECGTPGPLVPLRINFSSEDSILAEESRIGVRVVGVVDVVYPAQAVRQETELEDTLVLSIKTVTPDGKIDPNGVQGILSLNVRAILGDRMVPSGLGELKITKFPSFPTLRELYKLSDCKGIL